MRVLAASFGSLNSITRTHMVKGENQLVLLAAHMHTQTKMDKEIQSFFFKEAYPEQKVSRLSERAEENGRPTSTSGKGIL